MKVSINVKLSIIIPTYRRKEMLKICISSIYSSASAYLKHRDSDGKRQRHSHGIDEIEIIVVQDGPDKETSSMLKGFREANKGCLHLKVIVQENHGPAAARNNGMRHAKGDIIIFLDDDCIVEKDWIESIIKAHSRKPKVLAIAGRILPMHRNLIEEFSQSIEGRASLKNGTYFMPSLVNNNSYKREAFRKVKYFDESFRHASGEDVEFNARLHVAGVKTMFVSSITIRHRYRDTLSEMIRQQFGFGKEKLRLVRVANDYPFPRKPFWLYFLKRLATPFLDPWLRIRWAIIHKRRYAPLYLPLGYIHQASYWAGFIVGANETGWKIRRKQGQ